MIDPITDNLCLKVVDQSKQELIFTPCGRTPNKRPFERENYVGEIKRRRAIFRCFTLDLP
jgi:hypothetical protein